MYVLHHADKPAIYAGLPKDPRISPVVELWKGVTKYAGLPPSPSRPSASCTTSSRAPTGSAEDEKKAKGRREGLDGKRRL